jgi:cyanophycinase-like exopeptidase
MLSELVRALVIRPRDDRPIDQQTRTVLRARRAFDIGGDDARVTLVPKLQRDNPRYRICLARIDA